MNDKGITVKELFSQLFELVNNGYGDKIVELSVNYDHCDHIQPLKEVHYYNGKYIDWITLRGR